MNCDVADLRKVRKNSSDPASVEPTVRLGKMSDNMRADIGLLGRGFRENSGGHGRLRRACACLWVRLWVGDINISTLLTQIVYIYGTTEQLIPGPMPIRRVLETHKEPPDDETKAQGGGSSEAFL